jgi:multiple sugar transport system substrate-binding protein
MDQEIDFSIMASSPDGIQPLLDLFEAEQHIHVRLRLLTWDSAWSVLVKAALYKDSPDVSEIGTTWMGDLVGMNALRAFNAAEVASFGKASSFFPSAWNTATQYGDRHVWAIPWLVGSRMVYYRAQLLERAGVDPQAAFSSIEAFQSTVSQLHSSEVKIPWTVPTGYTHTHLHNSASWVWAAGGDFLSDDGKTTRFIEPEALAGLRAYFSLGRFLAPQVRHLNRLEPDDVFLTDTETAITLSGAWLFCRARQRENGFEEDPIAVALPPGASFVGGSNLAIWKYSRNPEAAVKLIRFLTQPASQLAYGQQVGLLPSRVDALTASSFSSNPFWQTSLNGLQSGRTFPTVRLWGLVEDRLALGLSAVWADVLADPSRDPHDALVKHLSPLAGRLDELLKQE